MFLNKEVDRDMWLITEGGTVCQKDPSEGGRGKGQSSEGQQSCVQRALAFYIA